jgi:hypothetical protein
MNCQGCGRKRSWSNLKQLQSWLFSGRTQEDYEKFQSEQRGPARDTNSEAAENKAKILDPDLLLLPLSNRDESHINFEGSRNICRYRNSQCLTTDWTVGGRSPTEAEDFSSNLCVQTGSGAHPVSCTMGTGGSFPGGKARPGRNADHSPPSIAEVNKE